MQVADLTKQLLELKHLAKNKDKIEELERRAAQAEGYTKEAQVQHRDDMSMTYSNHSVDGADGGGLIVVCL